MLAFYFRVSTNKQVKDETIEVQKMLAQKYIDEQELKAGSYQFYEDAGISGKYGREKRSGLDELQNDIEAKTIDTVWFYHQDRLTRDDGLEVARMIDFFDSHDVKLYFYNSRKLIDLKNEDDRTLFKVQAIFNAKVRRGIIANTKNGRNLARDEGRLAYSPIYGYERDGRDERGNWKWKPDEIKLSYVKKMYDEILSGKTLRQAYIKNVPEKMLDCGKNDLSYWYHRLRRPEYVGFSYKSDKKTLVRSTIYTYSIGTIDDFYRLQEKLTLNKINRLNYFDKADYTATGILKCFYCKTAYYNNASQVKGKRYTYYIHYDNKIKEKCENTKTIKKEYVDIFLSYIYAIEYIDRLFNEKTDREHKAHLLNSLQMEDYSNIDNLEEKREKLRQRQKSIADKLDDLNNDDETLLNVYLKLRKQLKEIEERLEKLKLSKTTKEQDLKDFIETRSVDKLTSYFCKGEDTKNQELRLFIRRAYVKDGEVFIISKLYETYKVFLNGIKQKDYITLQAFLTFITDTLKVIGNNASLFKEKIKDTYLPIRDKYSFKLENEDISEVFQEFATIIEEKERLLHLIVEREKAKNDTN